MPGGGWAMRGSEVLIVDGDEKWRDLVEAALTRAGIETVSVGTGANALAAAREARPAVVLLEVALPDIDGYEVCFELRQAFGDSLPILFTTTDRLDAHDRVAALLIGGDDYVVRPLNPSELVARVRRHLVRGAPPRASERDKSRSAGFGLTPRELQVLQRLAIGATPVEIARELGIRPRTVASHLQRALAKMRVHSRVQAVALAHASGLLGSAAELLTA
jgi:DNA-binding response OmpR family regulator